MPRHHRSPARRSCSRIRKPESKEGHTVLMYSDSVDGRLSNKVLGVHFCRPFEIPPSYSIVPTPVVFPQTLLTDDFAEGGKGNRIEPNWPTYRTAAPKVQTKSKTYSSVKRSGRYMFSRFTLSPPGLAESTRATPRPVVPPLVLRRSTPVFPVSDQLFIFGMLHVPTSAVSI